jgi:cell surface protein SprA
LSNRKYYILTLILLLVSSIFGVSSLAFEAELGEFFVFSLLQDFNLGDNLFKKDSATYKPWLYRGKERPKAKSHRKKLDNTVNSTTKLDSTGGYLFRRDLFNGEQINDPQYYSLDSYLKLRKDKIQLSTWDSISSSYDIKKSLSRTSLSNLLNSAGGLEIPLPQSPLMGIFGKPEININVNGEVNLRAGWRFDSQNLGTVSAFGQSQSTPIFSQDVRVNVSGGIGDKVRLSTDWNTRTTMNRDNRFKIGFDGYDDDIIKKVEFGNVSLPLTSSLISGGQALFGVRADFQFGPLFLKTLLSQRRGERRFVDARGGSSKQYFQIRAYDFAKNHFFLDTVYKPIYKSYFKSGSGIIPIEANKHRIKYIEVYESQNQIVVQDAVINAKAFADLPDIGYGEKYSPALRGAAVVAGEVEAGRFQKLDTTKYKFDRNLGTLTILNLKQDRTYAVAYRTEGLSTVENDDRYFGTNSLDAKLQDTLILKLVSRMNFQPGFKTLWSRQMRNIYQVNAQNINANDTKIGLWYFRQSNDSADVIQGAPDKIVTILGVDQRDLAGQAKPDGQFDLSNSPFFNLERGEIVFPTLEPFREGLIDYFTRIGNPAGAEPYIYPEIYDTTEVTAKRNTARDRFVISGEVSGRAVGRINLNAFNLAPGSVRVSLDGVTLKEYSDYIVDYTSGNVTIKNDRANLPNANLRVEYEQQNVIDVATKTQAGLRADYRLFQNRTSNADIGMTLMHYNQATLVDRVQLGQEPVANTMLGFDLKYTTDAPIVTKALDLLPFFDTKAPSSFNIGGEWAIMLPTPNRRTSTIASDLGSPVVFLDDFEAAMRTIAIGMNPTQWSHSSAPLDDKISINDAERGLYRGKFFWYKRFIPYVPSIEVYPEKEVLTGNARISPLEIDFSPDFRGIYNRNPQFLDTLNPDYVNQSPKWAKLPENRSKIWGGMQRLLSTFNTNFDNENVEFLEVVMKIDEWEPTTKFYIDLGQISEDVIGNGTLDTEDGSTDASRIPNGRIDPGEDNGIDTLNNEREKATYPAPLNLEADPARDDYFFDFTKNDEIRTRNDWDKYNNFEGNGTQSELGQFPDKEILNENNGQTISLDNSYFRYEVIVDPDPNKNTQIVGGANGWYMYRLPIRRPKEKVGNPLFSNIQYARLIVQGGNIKARIVDWRLVGSQWQRFHNFQSNLSPFDSTLSLAFVNLFENSREPDFYSLPPGVQAPIQPNVDPNRTLRLNEQSLSLSVKNLRFGDERMAIRVLPRFDLFYYKKMKFFIHGDGSMPSFIDRNSTPKAFAYFRFGTDSSNYYEYKKPLLRGWQDIEIDLNEITAIKQIRDTSRFIDRQVFPTKNDPLATFAVRGEPILTKVQFIGVGIANPSERFPNELSTTMWINELRLIEPEQRADWAAVGSADLKLADLGSINASMNMTQPNFHRLEERFGNRTSQGNFTVTVNGNLEKFAPASFTGMKLPITYTHAEFTTNPEFVANNDVNLEQAAIVARNSLPATATEEERIAAANNVLTRSQTLKVQDSWALTSVKLGIPVKYWLVDDIFNKMTFGYSYSQEFERSPIFQERFNWLWKFNSQYQNTIPEFLAIEPLLWAKDVPILKTYQKWKFNILPTNINFGLDLSRRRQTEQSRFLELPSPIIRDFTANRSAQLNWKLSNGGFLNPVIDYTVRNTSTLLPYEFAEDGSQRTGSEIIKNMFANDGEFLKFGNSTMHTQNVSIIMKPVIPDIYGLNKHLDMTSSFNTDYNWNDPLQPDPTIRDRAKNVNFNNRLRFSIGLGLMALTDEWFGVFKPSPFMAGPRKDSTSSIWSDIGSALKTIFFDFRKIDIVFDQTNTSTNPSVFGGTGMNNFWGRGLTFRESQDIYGPSMAYQLGLVEHPHGGINLVRSTAFPFFGFQTTPGLRPANTIAQDNFTQKTNFTITTSRQLWEGFTLDLNWKTNLGFNKNQTVITEANGVPQFSNIQALESFNRTFISLPSLFGVNVFGNRLENVARSFEQRRIQIEATETDSVIKNRRLQDAIAQSFYNELEAFSFTGGRIGRFLPSMNWGIRWEGLEKIPLWSSVVRKIEVRHAYTSTYDESVLINDQGRAIQNQTIATGFSPLVEVNMTFDEKKLDGRLTATLRWNNTNNFNVNAASRSAINSQTTNEINANATYNMRGFKMDFLGIDLQNDLEMSFLFTYKSNSSESLNILSPTASQDNAQGQQIRGDTQIIVEPRARYSLSNRVTATAFFRYESQASQGAGSPGFSTTQFGVDVRISISGGR